jgi:hypothetical protein
MVGNGLAWGAITIVYLLESRSPLLHDIQFQSTAAIFQASSANKEAMKKFVLGFKQTCDNKDAFYKLIYKVNFTYTVKAILDFWSEHVKELHSGTIDINKFLTLFNRKFAK